MHPAGPVHDQLDTLATTLNDIADALVNGHGNALVASEATLASAVALLPDTVAAYRTLDERTRAALLSDLLRSSQALARCRRHGTVLHALADLTFAASGRQATYDRLGSTRAASALAQFATQG